MLSEVYGLFKPKPGLKSTREVLWILSLIVCRVLVVVPYLALADEL